MEEKEFELTSDNIVVYIENNNVKLYILNDHGTVVRTIDEFEAKQGGE